MVHINVKVKFEFYKNCNLSSEVHVQILPLEITALMYDSQKNFREFFAW